jgi:outer membrane biosynthesis protein TonB
MLKALLVLILPAAFGLQCGARQSPPAHQPSANSQQVNATPKTEQPKCDFSEYKPLKVRANRHSQMLSMPAPEYPLEAKRSGAGGSVAVLLLVNVRSGLVERACVLSGDESLKQAAMSAALRVKFAPYSSYIQERHGHAEELVTYNFTAQ